MTATSSDPPTSPLARPEMPTLAMATSKVSRSYQRIARWALGLALALVTLAAVASLFNGLKRTLSIGHTTVNIATTVAAIAFALALLVRLYRIMRRPERVWYESRSLTEQAKSLAWTYAVGGSPFAKSTIIGDAQRESAEDDFARTLQGLVEEATRRAVPIGLPRKGTPVRDITEWMATTRRGSPAERARIYGELRIGDQQRFYDRRVDRYARIARRWNLALFALEGAGVAAALLRALGVIHLDLIGVAGTLAAAGTAWLQFNQFSSLSSVYAAMEYKLARFARRCAESSWTEEAWATFVREVEDLLGDEHSSWRQNLKAQESGSSKLLP
ncbi:MAG TPA: DUF4231 domain-containing protein [Ktedonobacterales bacterium]|nr:DUF4231 domain-containing protein [Ktedonobacterales bacterium]